MASLHYTEQGTGPPLTILHGLFGSGRNWMRVARRLADRFRVITPDLRNHGQSPHLPGMGYPEMAADLFELLERLGLPSTLLMGHSMGGKVAMTAALEAPERVRALIVVDIAPVRYRHSFEPIFQALKPIPVEWIHSRQEAERLLAGTIDDGVLRAFLLQNLNRDENGFHWRINLDAIIAGMPEISDFPLADGGHVYPGPALFLAGEHSHHLRPEHYPKVYELFPAARIEVIPGSGHWPHTEQPQRFLELVEGFLTDLPAGPGTVER